MRTALACRRSTKWSESASTTITTADPDNLVDTDNDDGSSDAIVNPIKASGEYTVEAWIVPGPGTQSGPARVVSNAPDPFSRNFMVGQGAYGNLPNDVFSMSTFIRIDLRKRIG